MDGAAVGMHWTAPVPRVYLHGNTSKGGVHKLGASWGCNRLRLYWYQGVLDMAITLTCDLSILVVPFYGCRLDSKAAGLSQSVPSMRATEQCHTRVAVVHWTGLVPRVC